MPKKSGMTLDNWVCPICGKGFIGTGPTTVRELWIKRGGFGAIPPEAIVHVKCDARNKASHNARDCVSIMMRIKGDERART